MVFELLVDQRIENIDVFLPRIVRNLQKRGIQTIITYLENESTFRARPNEDAILVGDDSLVARLLPTLAESGVQVGVIPVGRHFDLIRGLNIPADWEKSLSVFKAPQTMMIDMGTGGMVGYASLGFPSLVKDSGHKEAEAKGTVKRLFNDAREYLSPTRVEMELMVDQGTMIGCFAGVFVMNLAYAFGHRVSPQADPGDGLLDLITISHCSGSRFRRILADMDKGVHLSLPEVGFYRTSRLTMTCSEETPLVVDGRVSSTNKFEMKLRPKVVKVITEEASKQCG